jgi:hypothetical protein
MTQQIRKNVFETNSSSSHSLTLSQSDLTTQPFSSEVLRSGTLLLEKGEFGWEWRRYYDTDKKVEYLFTQLFHDDIPEGDAATVTAELRASEPRFDMLCRVIKEHTGLDVQVVPGSEGYIDHESDYVGMDLFQDESKLTQFLFSPDSSIETGNDNSPAPSVIETDRGDEHYYSARYREPKSSDVEVALKATSKWHYQSYATAGGALLDGDNGSPELYAALKEQATVTRLEVDCQSPTEPYRYSDPQSHTMRELADAGFSFVQGLAVSVQYKRMSRNEPEKHCEHRTFFFSMPADLAEKLAALPATPKEAVEVDG